MGLYHDESYLREIQRYTATCCFMFQGISGFFGVGNHTGVIGAEQGADLRFSTHMFINETDFRISSDPRADSRPRLSCSHQVQIY